MKLSRKICRRYSSLCLPKARFSQQPVSLGSRCRPSLSVSHALKSAHPSRLDLWQQPLKSLEKMQLLGIYCGPEANIQMQKEHPDQCHAQLTEKPVFLVPH